MMQNIPVCLRQHSPLHEAPKPGQATDEPLRGVNLLQEVIGEALDDGLHVRGTALHELHHLQHTAETVNAHTANGHPGLQWDWNGLRGVV